MNNIQQEINIHKNKLMSLINNLINTQLISEEIFFNNEIKKESEFLISILNIKKNILMNQININNNMNINFNPLINQLNPMMMNVPGININQIQSNFISNNFINNNEGGEIINVRFKNDLTGNEIILLCNPNEKISEVIKRYREKANDYDENHFLINNKDLNLNPSLTLSEFGIFNNHQILVYTLGALKSGNFCI